MNRRLTGVLALCVIGALAMVANVQYLSPPSRTATEAPENRADAPSARVTLSADGSLLFAVAGEEGRAIGTLESAEATVQQATLDRLRDRLHRVAAGAVDAYGWSTPTIAVAAAPATPWVRVLWILEVASSSVRIRRVRFELAGAPGNFVAHDLAYAWEPTTFDDHGESDPVLRVRVEEEDGVVAGATPPRPTMRVSMAVTRARDWQGLPVYGDGLDWRTSWATDEGVRRVTAEVGGASLGVTGCVVDVPRPQRPRLPYGTVFTVLRGLRDEGVVRVQFLNRSTTLPGER